MDRSSYDYNERPKKFDENDFWRQVRRTINGEPVEEYQIDLIANQVVKLLSLKQSDKLLDLGCGNGALSMRFLPYVKEIYGIDRSEYLIKIANTYFGKTDLTFERLDLENITNNKSFYIYNKCLLYGVSSFLEDEIIYSISKAFLNDTHKLIMFGNVRELEYAHKFYKNDIDIKVLNDTTTSMGKWRTREWFLKLANDLGLEIVFSKMPKDFYASKYYFDAMIRKK